MLDIREYLEEDGTSPFAEWFAGLDATAAAKITVVLARIEQGNLSNVKGVGEGVLEYRMDLGARLPGVFRPRRRRAGDPAGRWNEEAAAARHRGRAGSLGGLQAA